MKLLSITGREENIDTFIVKYLLESGLQTENAVKVFEKGWKLTNFQYDATAKDLLKECINILEKYQIPYNKDLEGSNIEKTLEEIHIDIETIKQEFQVVETKIEEKQHAWEEIREKVRILEHTKNLDVNIESLYHLKYLRFRYGKILKENFSKLERSLSDLDAFLLKIEEDEENIWIMCITTKEISAKVDSYLNVFKFERIWIPEELAGNPKFILTQNQNEMQQIGFEIEYNKKDIQTLKDKYKSDLIMLYGQLNLYMKINTVKKFMAHDENGLFYVIGWIPVKELKQILPKLSKEKEIKFVVKNHDEVASIPPTKLRNYKIIQPFETIVKMYGLPNYNELDPTLFVAITAFLLFGFMFGDVGHGLVIFIIGLFMSRKKIAMGPVFQAGGIASMVFGVLYGSIFGNEEIIPAILISPMENIQTMLIYGIAVGIIFIIIAMMLNIRNGIVNKDKKKIFFETNGIAGLLFYITVLVSGVYFLINGKMIASMSVLSVFVVLPLLAIMFKDTISEKLFKNKQVEKTSFVEKVFEIIEILLSFASNTISFVRIAAFAINHVGLCMAIYILANMVNGSANMVITIIGNAIVIVLEGLIVGIQVLRLEYYELFSRFYSGNGKEYKPLKEKI